MLITEVPRRYIYTPVMTPDFRSLFIGLDHPTPTLHGDQPYVNLDNAASTPAFASVMQAVVNFMPLYSSVHRGEGYKSRFSTQQYDQAHSIVGRFFGADPQEHVVIFGKNTTEALNLIAHRLGFGKKDIVLVSGAEHHSNDLPWRSVATVKRIAVTADGAVDRGHFEQLLQRYAGRIKIVTITGAANVTGHMPDVHWFARKTHQAGAQIVVDCAQLAAHRPIAMRPLGDPEHLDYIAVSGHKMYAPFGTGALVGRRDTFECGAPFIRGGGTVTFVSNKHVDWASTPDRDEAGSPNVVGAIALAQAVQTLQYIGLDSIAKHEADMTAYALTQLATVPGIAIYGDTDPANATSRGGVIAFTLQGISSQEVAAKLGSDWGVGIRSGCFCAQPYVFDLLGIAPTGQRHIRQALARGQRDAFAGLVRISFGMYNTRAEIDYVVAALRTLVDRYL